MLLGVADVARHLVQACRAVAHLAVADLVCDPGDGGCAGRGLHTRSLHNLRHAAVWAGRCAEVCQHRGGGVARQIGRGHRDTVFVVGCQARE